MNPRRRLLVISAVNFREGGPLTVLREAVGAARRFLGEEWRIVVLVNNAERVGVDGVEYREYRWPAKSWLIRLGFEYIYFDWLSRLLRPDIWFSLHDVSPFVAAGRQAVYCHNPAPFHRLTLREARLDWKLGVFNLVYKLLYRTNLESNTFVIVQQQWLRNEFQRWCRRPSVVVAHPSTTVMNPTQAARRREPVVFFYPAFPRVFKNFELIGEAVAILESRGITDFEVRITIAGTENGYAREIRRRYGHLHRLRFLGLLDKNAMEQQYSDCGVLLFVSKLETWGLPITEAKARGLGIVAADLPYAHETVGAYERVAFCPPDQPRVLADLLAREVRGDSPLGRATAAAPNAPFVASWAELIALLTKESASDVSASDLTCVV